MDLREKPFYLKDEEIKWVEDTLSRLTTKQKLGQLFTLMAGDYSDEEQDQLVSEYAVGGLLFRPIHTKAEFIAKYDRLDLRATVPLLKAANLEEGGIGGISDGTKFAFQEGIAATGEIEMAEKFAKVCAKEGLESGINWTYSPVSDIDINFRNPITNIRTYGSKPDTVLNYTRKYVETVQMYGMAACAKHFPGDGVDFRDQHLHPTYNTLSKSEWYDTYGKIYENMIDAGLYSIMVGHIVQPDVQRDINPELSDEELMPGSLSPELLQGVLREKFGFNGVITTDATIMGGYTMAMERSKAIPASIMAGIDMIVFSPDFYADLKYLEDALADGRLTMERIDEAVMRILALKARVALTSKVGEEVACSRTEVKLWAAECADKAVTLVKNRRNILPVTPGKYDKVKLIHMGKDDTCDGSLEALVTDYLKAEGLEVVKYDPFADDLHSPESCDKKQLTLYIACREAESNVTAVKLFWCPKHALDKVFGKSGFQGVNPVDPFCGLMDTRL